MSHCDYIDDLDSRQRFLVLLGFTLADLGCDRRSFNKRYAQLV